MICGYFSLLSSSPPSIIVLLYYYFPSSSSTFISSDLKIYANRPPKSGPPPSNGSGEKVANFRSAVEANKKGNSDQMGLLVGQGGKEEANTHTQTAGGRGASKHVNVSPVLAPVFPSFTCGALHIQIYPLPAPFPMFFCWFGADATTHAHTDIIPTRTVLIPGNQGDEKSLAYYALVHANY